MKANKYLQLLKEGKTSWNRWRKEYPQEIIDLSGTDLSKMNLKGFNLSYVNLEKASLAGASLVKADLSYANLRYANLDGANLESASCLHADFFGADLTNADLKNAAIVPSVLLLAKLSKIQKLDLQTGLDPVWSTPASTGDLMTGNSDGDSDHFYDVEPGKPRKNATGKPTKRAAARRTVKAAKRVAPKKAAPKKIAPKKAVAKKAGGAAKKAAPKKVAKAATRAAPKKAAEKRAAVRGSSKPNSATKKRTSSSRAIPRPMDTGVADAIRDVGSVSSSRGFNTNLDRHPDAATESHSDLVKCSLFAPPVTSPGQQLLVQVFAHTTEQAGLVQQLATSFDDSAQIKGSNTLRQKIQQGTELQFNLVMKGASIDDPVQMIVWRGEAEAVQFGVTIDPTTKKGNLLGSVYISQNSLPIGDIKFVLKVEEDASSSATGLTTPQAIGDWKQYKYAFISYASPDRNEVLKRVQMLSYYQTKFFQDILSLEPGQRWEKELYKNIDEADLFLLFWSKSALGSTWVMKEVEYAIERRKNSTSGHPEIFPVIIEKPPPLPPKALEALHFNDKIIYFIKDE